jgi:hypothetical protein
VVTDSDSVELVVNRLMVLVINREPVVVSMERNVTEDNVAVNMDSVDRGQNNVVMLVKVTLDPVGQFPAKHQLK